MESPTFGVPQAVLAVLLVASFGFFGRSVYRLLKFMLMGAPEDRFNKIGERLKSVLIFVVGQKRVVQEAAPGWGHFFIFYGFVILTVATIEVLGSGLYPPFSLHWFLPDAAYGALAALQEFFGVAVLIALALAMYRRWVVRPEKYEGEPGARLDATIILSLIGILMITMFATNAAELTLDEGLRRAWMKPFMPVSAWLAGLLFSGAPPETVALVRNVSWWTHVVDLLGFLCYIPHSKHIHILGAVPNVFFRKLESDRPYGALSKVNLEDESAQSFGVAKVEEYSWKRLLDTYACTECGRCQENCPAHNTGKPLNPKMIILNMKHHLKEKGAAVLDGADAEHAPSLAQSLIGDVQSKDAIWACTTCRACMEVCPVFIEHVDDIVDMRRYLVLMESDFPQEAQTAFRNWETNYNPWSMGYSTRGDWAEGLGVKTLAEDPNVEYLFYVGCAGSFDAKGKEHSRALVRLLQKAGVSFGILGAEEICNGETARRLGNEYLGQTLVNSNLEVLKNYGVKKIVSTCPHCFNTLKNEYPDFGGSFEVWHHTEFLRKLVADGRLKIENEVKEKITYHDSCYLGRYNDNYENPRELLQMIPGVDLVEMGKHGRKGMCCGAGGGRMWLEEKIGDRVNYVRGAEAISTGATTVAVACPFCNIMLTDGVKAKEAEAPGVQVRDIVMILEQAVGKGGAA